MLMPAWNPKKDAWCHLPVTLHLIPSYTPSPSSTALGSQVCAAVPGFYVGAGDPTWRAHSWIARALTH